MPGENEDLVGAISAAFPTDETPAEEAPAEEVPAEEAAPEGEEAPAEEAAPEGEEVEETPAEEAAPEGELDEHGKPKLPAKPADPLNDPLPKGTLKSTTERFNEIREIVKETNQKLETVTNERNAVVERYDGLVGAITGSGLNADTFNVMLDYASKFNSAKFEDREAAYDFLMGELRNLAGEIGRVPPGEHPLKGHDDLIKEIEAKTLTPQRAVEIAKQRNRETAIGRHQQSHGARLEQTQRDEQARGAARQELSKVGQELAKKDGAAEYKRKADLVLANIKDEIMALPPARWAAAFRKAYSLIPTAVAPLKLKPKGPQPLRGNKVPSGNASAQPKTMLEAISAAVDRGG